MGGRAIHAARTAAIAVALPMLVAACGFLPGSSSAWVWPTPFPRPSDAVPVEIDTEEIVEEIGAADVAIACPMALLAPMTPTYRADDAAQPVHYTLVDSGQEIRLIWQAGFQAWLEPELQIVAPDGKVIAAEGQIATNLSGGNLGGDDRFTVCLTDYLPRRAGAPS